jgi:hypothetical protein
MEIQGISPTMSWWIANAIYRCKDRRSIMLNDKGVLAESISSSIILILINSALEIFDK